MRHEIKKILFDALMNVIDDSPTLKKNTGYLRNGIAHNIELNVTQDEFNVWVDYMFSTLKIVSQHIEAYVYETARNQIQRIIENSDTLLANKILEIDKILLNLARNIVNR